MPADQECAARHIRADADVVPRGEAVFSAFLAGASGFLIGNTGPQPILDASRDVARGESLLDPSQVPALTSRLSAMGTGDPSERARSLSAREREVVALVRRG